MADQSGFADVDTKPDMTHDPTGGAGHTNKRKRGSLDNGGASRPAPVQRVSPGSTNSASAGATDLSDQATANFLAAHNASGGSDSDLNHPSSASLDFSQLHQNGGPNPSSSSDTAAAALHYSMTVPQSTELSFQSQVSGTDGDRTMGGSFNIDDHGGHSLADFGTLSALKASAPQGGNPASAQEQGATSTPSHKPPVGSDEWHKIRRDNHKEVERRRRETINEGINELAKIVPGCEKNKGSILQRAVQFIQQLKENESQNIEKWTLEKLLTEQAITELSASVDKFKADLQRTYEELEIWKRACQNAGITPDEFKDQGEGTGQNGDS